MVSFVSMTTRPTKTKTRRGAPAAPSTRTATRAARRTRVRTPRSTPTPTPADTSDTSDTDPALRPFIYVECRDMAENSDESPMLSFAHVSLLATDDTDAYCKGHQWAMGQDHDSFKGHFRGQLCNDYVIDLSAEPKPIIVQPGKGETGETSPATGS
jgi:hypothetical protein